MNQKVKRILRTSNLYISIRLVLLFFLLFHLNSIISNGQDTLIQKFEYSSLSKQIYKSKFLILPTKPFGNYEKFDSTFNFELIVFSYEKYLYERTKSNTDVEKNSKLIKLLNIDTTKIFKGEYDYFVGVLVKSEGSKKSVIVDSNNNKKFSDDSVYVLNDKDKQSVVMKVQIEILRSKNRISKQQMEIEIYFNHDGFNVPNAFERRNALGVSLYSQLSASIQTINQKFTIFFIPNRPGFGDNLNNYEILIRSGSNLEDDAKNVGKGELFSFKGEIFKILDISQDSLKIVNYNSMEEIKGNNIGDYLENFVLNQIKMGLDTEKANTIIYLFNPAESYDLVTLQKFENCKLKENNFNFAPIMCIRGENRKINLLNSEFNIQNKELIGVNGTINQILNVSIFPAIYIINSKGRILERINGKYSFEKIKHIFCKL